MCYPHTYKYVDNIPQYQTIRKRQHYAEKHINKGVEWHNLSINTFVSNSRTKKLVVKVVRQKQKKNSIKRSLDKSYFLPDVELRHPIQWYRIQWFLPLLPSIADNPIFFFSHVFIPLFYFFSYVTCYLILFQMKPKFLLR